MSWISNGLSSLTSMIGGQSIKDFPFTIGDPIEEVESGLRDRNFWKMHHGKRNDDGLETTIFVFDKKEAPGNHCEAAVNSFKKMKQFIPIPQMLKFLGGANTDNAIYIATEEVLPLSCYLDKTTDKSDELQSEGFVALGIHQISTAINFLNSDCSLVHGCLHPGSIYVNKAGSWKLGNFLLTHKFQEAGSEIKLNLPLLPERYHPKELVGGFSANLANGTVSSLDSWCMGCLIYEIYNGRMNSPKELKNLGNIHPQITDIYKRMLQTKPQQRASVNNLLKCQYIAKNPAVRAIAFIDDIALKSEEAKQKFYKSLNTIIEMIPQSCAQYRVLPAMLTQLQFGSGNNPVLLATVLKLGKKLSEEERGKMIIPVVEKMFENNERSTRINLLKHVKLYIDFVSDDVVEKKIFPNVISGFADTTPTLREVSVRSLISFAPKLSATTLNGKVLQILAKCQADPQPAIRTNTTVVIGEIAQYLSQEKQETVLASAITRTMKDKFVHARKASVLSVDKCIELFTVKQIAGSILPNLARLIVDPYKVVREPALKTVKKLVRKLEESAKDMPDEPEVQLSSEGNKPKEEKNIGSMVSSYTSWAVSSVAAKVTGKSSEDSKDETPKRIGDIDRKKFQKKNATSESPLNAHTRKQPKPQKKKKTSNVVMDDIDDIDGDDGDFNFDFSDDQGEDDVPAFDLSVKKKKKKPKTRGISMKKKIGTPPASLNPFEDSPSKSSYNSNPFEDNFNLGMEDNSPAPVDDPFAMFATDSPKKKKTKEAIDFDAMVDQMNDFSSKPTKKKSKNLKKKKNSLKMKKKKPAAKKNDDLDDFLNSFG